MSEELIESVEPIAVEAPAGDEAYAASSGYDDEGEDAAEDAAEEVAPVIDDVVPQDEITADVKQYIQNMVKEQGVEALAKTLDIDIPTSAHFAQLARKNSDLRKKEQEIASKTKRIEESEQLLRNIDENPFKFLEERLGKDAYSRYTDYVLSEGKESPEDVIKKEMATEREELNRMRQETQDQFKQMQQAQRLNQMESVTAGYESELSSTDFGTSYPSLAAFHLGDNDAIVREVYDILGAVKTQQAQQSGGSVSPRQVQSLLKEWTPDKVLGMLEAEAQKIGNRYQSLSAPVEAPTLQRPVVNRPTTLNSDMLASSAPSDSLGEDFDDLSDAEQIKRLVAKYG